MSCAVVFTERARADLREIAFAIADLVKDVEVGIRFTKELREKTNMLTVAPESGAWPKDSILKSNGVRFLTHKDYLLFYKYQKAENRVYIMAVLHSRRDYMRVMAKSLMMDDFFD